MENLSVAMIVKNEEACLRECLESVKDFKIHILDTGSTDKTCEIAREYTPHVYENEYEWNDNFAEARNYVLDKVDTDWVLSIDADEVLMNPEQVHKAIESNPEAKSINTIVRAKGGKDEFKFPRIFSKSKGVRWGGAIHNYVTHRSNIDSDVVIKYGYSPAHKNDPDRALRILTKQHKERPENARTIYYLAREYWYRKKYEKAVELLDEYIPKSHFNAEKADAYLMKARCLWNLQQGQKARETCMQAVFINPNFEEALYFLGQMHYEPMKSAWIRYSESATNEDVLFVRKTFSRKRREAFPKICQVLNESGIFWWGACGTALGAYRDGMLIDADKDIDVGIWYKDKEKMEEHLKKTGLKTYKSGDHHLKFFIDGMKVDINLHERAGEKVRFSLDQGAFYYTYSGDIFDTFHSARLYGEDLNIPSPGKYLTESYGDWKERVNSWNYREAPCVTDRS